MVSEVSDAVTRMMMSRSVLGWVAAVAIGARAKDTETRMDVPYCVQPTAVLPTPEPGSRPSVLGCPPSGRDPCEGDPTLEVLMRGREARFKKAYAMQLQPSQLKVRKPRPVMRARQASLFLAVLMHKLPFQHFARVLGLRLPRQHFCTTNVTELLDVHNASIHAPRDEFVIKRHQGHGSQQTYVIRGGVEQLRARPMTLAEIVADVTDRHGTAHRPKKFWHFGLPMPYPYTYAVEGVERAANESLQGAIVAPDVKVFAFGERAVGHMTHLAPMGKHQNWDLYAWCFACEHVRGCTGGVPSVRSGECFAVLRGRDCYHPLWVDGRAGGTPVVRAPYEYLPAHGAAMLRLSAIITSVLRAMVRVDWYDSARGPVLQELTFLPCMHMDPPCTIYGSPFHARLFRAHWRGLEGGGSPLAHVPCWLPRNWPALMQTCAGFGEETTLEDLIRANCEPSASSLADQVDVRRWRAAAAAIRAVYEAYPEAAEAPDGSGTGPSASIKGK